MTTGMFSVISARAAEEELDEVGSDATGKSDATDVTPYWRTLRAGGVLNEKYPGGVELQKARLEEEGHRVALKGKKHVVVDFEQSLAEL